jgi:ABC-type multidrug transport system permease subunit
MFVPSWRPCRRIGNDPQSNANTIAAILFLWSMLTAFTSMGILPSIVLERPVTNREIYDGLFSEKTFVIYKLQEELLPQILTGLAYSALVFYLVDLQGSFLLFWLVYLVSTANAIACTLFVSAVSPNTSVAGALMSSYATTLFFFSGFLIPYSKIPVYWRWYSTIDHLRYAFGAMMANQFGGVDPVFLEGQTILQYYDLENVYDWAWLGYESLFFPVFALLMWAALTFVRYTRQ